MKRKINQKFNNVLLYSYEGCAMPPESATEHVLSGDKDFGVAYAAGPFNAASTAGVYEGFGDMILSWIFGH